MVRDRMQALYERVTSLIPVVADEPERAESLLAALGTSQEAFEKYMDAVSDYRLALAGSISGNGMRSLEALTMIDLCTQRISILEGISRDLELDVEIAEQVRIGRVTGKGPFCGS